MSEEIEHFQLPWTVGPLAGWSIVGMNHYHLNGERALFVAMTKNNICIKAEGADEQKVFGELSRQAAAFIVFAKTSPINTES